MNHKEIKKSIQVVLENALLSFEPQLGSKKYSSRIKKAAKIIAEGLGKETQNDIETKEQAAIAKSLETAIAKPLAKPSTPAKKTIPTAKKAVNSAKKAVSAKKVVSNAKKAVAIPKATVAKKVARSKK